MRNFILLAPPGGGKGTQSEYLVKKLNFTHISTGNIIRNNIKHKTPLGILCWQYYEQGKLVPDDIMIKIVENHLKIVTDDLIWDGFPRTIAQAKKLDKLLKKWNSKVNNVLYFKINEEKLIDRIIGRLICPICGQIYHKTAIKPKIEWICDNDKTSLVQRKDDNEEKIKIRLKIYHNDTAPLIAYYLNRQLLTVINANMEEHVIWNQIITVLK